MGLSNPGPAWLFCPADRAERYQKAAAAADVVILDLEDGCAAADRPAARQALVDVPLDPARTVVRVNQFGTADQELDLQALKNTPYDTVMLPKCEAVEHVSALAPLNVIVLVESPMGALAVTETVQVDNAIAVMWGAEDLFAVLGGTGLIPLIPPVSTLLRTPMIDPHRVALREAVARAAQLHRPRGESASPGTFSGLSNSLTRLLEGPALGDVAANNPR